MAEVEREQNLEIPNLNIQATESKVTQQITVSQPTTMSERLTYITYAAIFIIVLALIVIIGWGTGQENFLASLEEIRVARGLITFLIAITTVGIAVILAVSTIFGNGGEEDNKRFERGKQILSTLIGVLGTIVGFYFGSSPDNKISETTPVPQTAQTLTIAPANLSNPQPKKGEKIIISSFVFGGKAPYLYSIAFDPPLIPTIRDIPSLDGSIRQEVTVPITLEADKDINYQINVRDSENMTAYYNKEGGQRISLKSK